MDPEFTVEEEMILILKLNLFRSYYILFLYSYPLINLYLQYKLKKSVCYVSIDISYIN